MKKTKLERAVADAIAERTREARTALGISQEELGARAGVHRTYIGAIERAEKSITVVTLAKLAIALGCKLQDLIPERINAN